MNSTLKLFIFIGLVSIALAQLPSQTQCHVSCECDSQVTECAECNLCSRCRQQEGTQMVNRDFCQCLTPDWRLKQGSEWECERVGISVPVANCEWQLFNQIFNMVVHSKCSLEKAQNGQNFIQDIITYDWLRLTVQLDKECISQLVTRLLWAKDCTNYVPLDLQYVISQTQNSLTLRIPLIDIYNLTQNTQLTGDGRTIYQIVCFAIELGHLRRVIRQHRFQMRVYTNRDQVEVFHLTVEKQITEGCDKGQECIIVANLDTEGRTCSDQTCTSYLAQGTVPVYTVGNHMYVRILFKDNSYTKYLHVVTVKFIDDAGIYNYVRNIQWWTLRQGLGSTDVDILLFQPHVNALVEVSLKIALSQDALRNLAEKNEIDEVKQNFHVQVQSKPKNTETEKANFSSQLLCGLALSALTLIL